ncbi:DUF1292 domain-containing protein [Dolosicoccus paucivorans]|uniref:UPF0473 protein CJ205_05755 n=1 Tax=Dolosicoccus paucivorans TaxID=84521 RepID=A0A1G8JAC1_9LACT|nr:DUF1292 domain-containing protein [Dolosicoccus paucivorans]PMB84583.1 DUF1292 domain-containing protein [Dolosicoccus paucivorans]PMC58148.1 DUF1292 domain-containing protein [Dolosicoccus paucivorans]SDI28023.1 Uncharacterized protein YrzB, UPF0473 family [Dolosicoccus paucivorans]
MSENYEPITLIDEEGNEALFEVLFTFESKDYNKNYVVVYPAGALDEEDVELFAYSYVEQPNGESGELQEIQSDEEWDMIEEVLATFLSDENMQ